MLKGNPNWDGRVWNVQVTKTTEQYKELRVLMSSTDAAKNWDLRADIREKLIDFINENYPESFAKIRILGDQKIRTDTENTGHRVN
jgi:hypothetical protein